MNERLKKYLEKKEQEKIDAKKKEKADLLIREGLCEKVFIENWSDECAGYDNETGQYYNVVPIEISDEEYELLKNASDFDGKSDYDGEDAKNSVATALTVIAGIVYGGGGFAGIVFLEDAFALSMICWASCFISGTMFLGFAEIIKLLDAIKRK